MSKIMDAPENKFVKKHVSGLGVHDEIARTYFHAPQKKNAKKGPEWISFLPWAITAFVIVAAMAVILSKSTIDIKVTLLGEIPAPGVSRSGAALEKGVFLIKGGSPQIDIIKDVYFAGDAKAFSDSRQEEVVLCNARRAGWANYTIELKEPVDLNKLDIKYAAKGDRGGECLVLIITDNGNRTYRMEKDLSSSLTGDWVKYTVNSRAVKKALDLSNITAIKFEFGSLTAGNYSGAVIYLKDIYLAKTRRLKWL
jgi:hypothetical protein